MIWRAGIDMDTTSTSLLDTTSVPSPWYPARTQDAYRQYFVLPSASLMMMGYGVMFSISALHPAIQKDLPHWPDDIIETTMSFLLIGAAAGTCRGFDRALANTIIGYSVAGVAAPQLWASMSLRGFVICTTTLMLVALAILHWSGSGTSTRTSSGPLKFQGPPPGGVAR